ncbi:MAG TPA: hypothetical protein VLB80_03290 [Candidatus Babeliales bacterium]|nr:hypothetical protein [Candidatus Babeliales bacterium]
MITTKNIVFCSILFASIHSYAMEQNNTRLTLTKEQATNMKEEVSSHIFRNNEKFYCLDNDVAELIQKNLELQIAFKNCKTYIQPPETKESRFEQFSIIVDSLVNDNQ